MKRFIKVRSIQLFGALFLILLINYSYSQSDNKGLIIGEAGYFEMPGLNVLVYNNTFAEGHQGGVEIIQHDNRVATNGEIRLSPSPGQWQPIPQLGEGYKAVGVSPQEVGLKSRIVDKESNQISISCSYPDTSRLRKGFNPIIYPDLEIKYTVKVKAHGQSFSIVVDFDEPSPEEWVGRIGYILELFPGDLYGKTYIMDDRAGTFPRQANGPTYFNNEKEAEAVPLAYGKKLVIAPESDLLRMTIESKTELQLLDGSLKHNNGWFIVRSIVPESATKEAIHWEITPHVIKDWMREPVVHISQVGYHPKQNKTAFIELDKNDDNIQKAALLKIEADGTQKVMLEQKPAVWGEYLRYNYLTFDFSKIKEPGMYQVQYSDFVTNPFSINQDVYERHVWQPTLEYFIPIQMCHMRVNQKYRVWHGACHLDDALMMPLNVRHFDGYNNEPESSTLTSYKPLEPVPGLNVGGWHDAGDYDLRVESQAMTVMALVYTYEEFGIDYDETYIDQENRHVELHQPDGKPDILQQVEHGVLTILAGYRQFGQLYRGIIAPTLRQYVHLGDAATHTDNIVFDNEELREKAAQMDELWYKKVANRYSNVFDPEMNLDEVQVFAPELDDRLVFMETNPGRQLLGAASLAAAARVLKGYDDALVKECLEVAEALWEKNKDGQSRNRWLAGAKVSILTELILTTGKDKYKKAMCQLAPVVERGFPWFGWSVARVMNMLDCPEFEEKVTEAAVAYKTRQDSIMQASPFGSPLENIESLAFRQYYLHKAWPEVFDINHMFNALNYLLGCRPGNTTNSLVSGVGVNSPTVAYGTNRADWSYIPGGTFWNAVNLVHPDYAEDKVWPFLWQEREYIITAPCYYMFAVIATDRILDKM